VRAQRCWDAWPLRVPPGRCCEESPLPCACRSSRPRLLLSDDWMFSISRSTGEEVGAEAGGAEAASGRPGDDVHELQGQRRPVVFRNVIPGGGAASSEMHPVPAMLRSWQPTLPAAPLAADDAEGEAAGGAGAQPAGTSVAQPASARAAAVPDEAQPQQPPSLTPGWEFDIRLSSEGESATSLSAAAAAQACGQFAPMQPGGQHAGSQQVQRLPPAAATIDEVLEQLRPRRRL
jgi:hypothetical protein